MKKKLVLLGYIILVILISTYPYIKFLELNDYVGDEVWYVSATRNVLHKLGFAPKYEKDGYYGVNVIFPENVDKNNLSLKIKIWSKFSSCQNSNRGYPEPPARTQVDYQNINGFYYEIRGDCLQHFLSPDDNITTITGYRYPDKKNIVSYLNTEHPFFGKGLIGLSMLMEDSPFFWRIPGFIERIGIIILVTYLTYIITRSYLTAAISATIVSFDKLLLVMSVTAMLDIHVAFFTLLSLVMLIKERYRLSGVFLGLSIATKLNSLALIPVFAFILLKDNRKKELAYISIIAIVAFIIAHIPLFLAIGPAKTLGSLISSIKWHLSVKENHPANSPFWTWFYSSKPFYLHYNPTIKAKINERLFQAVILSSILYPAILRRTTNQKSLKMIYMSFWMWIIFYAFHYSLGGKNQYSFYATPIIPLATIIVSVLIGEIINREVLEDV